MANILTYNSSHSERMNGLSGDENVTYRLSGAFVSASGR